MSIQSEPNRLMTSAKTTTRQPTATKPRIGKPAAGRVLIPVDDDEGRADERKAGTEVRRAFSLCNPKEKQCADAVHQKNDRGVDPKQRGNQHRRAEHCEHVLYA